MVSRFGLAASFALVTAVTTWSVAASAQQPPPAGGTGDTLIPPDPPPSTTTSPSNGTPVVDPGKDQQKLVVQGQTRPLGDGTIGARPQEVFSEDWWSHTRPIVELHGYFRTRAELYHNFFLGRHSGPGKDDASLWAPPLDHTYGDFAGAHHPVTLCNDPDPTGRFGDCIDKTQSSANLRLRLNPEIHISDNLRIMSQVDLLDNLVLGSTPDAYAIRPSAKGASGYSPYGYNGYAPLGVFSTTQGPPTSGVNSYKNSVEVQRAWAEYTTPLGQIRFGRMPSHWGLGMVVNSGDGIDQDYQTNVDRVMFVTGLKSLDLYFGGMWDFVSSGPTNASPYDVYGGQPYNTANLVNVDEWAAFVAHRTNPETERLKLSRNEPVFNGGIYSVYRKQLLDVVAGETPLTADTAGTTPNNGLERRGAAAFIPDIWIQFLYQKFRAEAEVASIWGQIENSPASSKVNDPIKVRQFGFTVQTELKAVEDKLRIKFDAGWASGDPNIEGIAPGGNGLQARKSEGPISTFRFNPAYNVDQIFFRRILTRVQGAYYFKPGVEYDFLRNPGGQKFGGGANIVWSRASEFVQAPGNKRDLGVELDMQVYYQSKDGTLNDDPNKMGGFYAALQYGVFFPLSGLDYLPGVRGELAGTQPKLDNYDLSTAQIVRLLLGVMF